MMTYIHIYYAAFYTISFLCQSLILLQFFLPASTTNFYILHPSPIPYTYSSINTPPTAVPPYMRNISSSLHHNLYNYFPIVFSFQKEQKIKTYNIYQTRNRKSKHISCSTFFATCIFIIYFHPCIIIF